MSDASNQRATPADLAWLGCQMMEAAYDAAYGSSPDRAEASLRYLRILNSLHAQMEPTPEVDHD